MADHRPLVVTMGEPAGIGGDIALAAWAARDVPGFFVIDDADRLRRLADRLGLEVPIMPIDAPEQASAVFATALPVLHRPLAAPAIAGRPDPANGEAVIAAIAEAVRLASESLLNHKKEFAPVGE